MSRVPNEMGGRDDHRPRYRTIVADPPWKYDGPSTTADANRHYPTMTTDAIAALGVDIIPLTAFEGAHLWLWTTNAMVEQAHWICRAWGFVPLTMLTWCKTQPGMGHYLRNNTEHCVLATRGKPAPPEKKPMSTWMVWPRTKHSEKPDAFYDIVEQVSPGPYLELFARKQRMGWDVWGNEVDSHVEMVS